MLFRSVKSAFPSVDITRLVHNMRKQGIPKEYTNWLTRRLRSNLTFDGFQSEHFNIKNGLDQGDPLSGILYLLYNSDLPQITDIKRGE